MPNAFVTGNNKIVFTSGLLKYISNSEALFGVIAHEIGHLKNFHITKRLKKTEDMKILNQFSNLAAITSAIFLKNPETFLQSNLITSSNIKNYYSTFSKNQEKEADLFAIERLNDLIFRLMY